MFHISGTDGILVTYYNIFYNEDKTITFNHADGTYCCQSSDNLYMDCKNKTIETLKSEGRTFNFLSSKTKERKNHDQIILQEDGGTKGGARRTTSRRTASHGPPDSVVVFVCARTRKFRA
jgi:hypothetical protein